MHPVLASIETLLTQADGRWHPATEEQIQRAEKRMRLTFPPLLREFLKTFGRAYIDATVTADIGDLSEDVSKLFGCTGENDNLLEYFDLSDIYGAPMTRRCTTSSTRNLA